MFVFVLGWLAQYHKGWVVLTTGTALAVAAIGIFLAGVTTHQPLISRVGVLVAIVAILFAVVAVRARRPQAHKSEDG